ncbi:hypothetical protein CS0771_52280 [Catellatospora sp. IY07-71]|nr:hypothetical protein CS0771_52280 [Catellatospora sp. IY07-71]
MGAAGLAQPPTADGEGAAEADAVTAAVGVAMAVAWAAGAAGSAAPAAQGGQRERGGHTQRRDGGDAPHQEQETALPGHAAAVTPRPGRHGETHLCRPSSQG